MKDFESVDRYEVVANCEKGYWLEPEGEFVEYSDYKDLLEEFKYSESSATEGWIFFEMINSFLVENDLLEITHKGGAKEAALNVIESIKNLNEKYKELLWMREKLEK